MIHFIQGEVRQTIDPRNHTTVAVLRLDTDTYASTLHELTALYDKVCRGGVPTIDDYGYSRGCWQVVDEFFQGRPAVFFQRPNQGARIAIKLDP